jgi:hypothetical protein
LDAIAIERPSLSHGTRTTCLTLNCTTAP